MIAPPADNGAPDGRPRVLLLGVVGAVLLWLSQPPAGLWPLAWVAPVCWLWLADSPAEFGRREYLRVGLAGTLYWLLAVHWVRLPHPLTPLGWAPLAMYLGLYPLAMVFLVRQARRRWRAPLWLAAPVVWTGLELLQARLFTGFLMGAVSHSQAGQPWIRSVAAYVGAYGVTFAVVLVAATLTTAARSWRAPDRPRALTRVVAAMALVVLAGWAARVGIVLDPDAGYRPRVALIQGDTRATWEPDSQRGQRIMDRQVALSVEAHRQAQRDGRPLDLVVWPENMFRSWLLTFNGSLTPPAGVNESTQAIVDATDNWLRSLTTWIGDTPVLVGIDRFDWLTDDSGGPLTYDDGSPVSHPYNSVLLADGSGAPVSFYDKTHLVPFGEYIPFARGAPILYYLTPLQEGLHSGAGPVSMDVPLRDGGALRLCPSICYETVIPRVIRRQVAELTRGGERPDALVNVTNDAWFWGSSELDMHLACSVYRAVENGLPMLVAANGGLTAVIDATGRVVDIGPRMAEHVLIADTPPRTSAPTLYTQWGDWFAGVCLAACATLAACRFSRWGRLYDRPGDGTLSGDPAS